MMTGEFSIALRAMALLNGAEGLLSSDKLAVSVGANPARVRKVMSRLKTAGLILAKEGAAGGYSMDRDPSGITLDMLVDALGIDVVAPRAHAEKSMRELETVMSELFRQMNSSCREKLKLFSLADVVMLMRQDAPRAVDETSA